LFLHCQTFFGIRDLLAPLLAENAVSVIPMQARLPGQAWLIEICPASTVKLRLGWKKTSGSYKRATKDGRLDREVILNLLECSEGVNLSPCVERDRILSNSSGDALDSVIAAAATARAVRDEFRTDPSTEATHRIEGHIYF